MTARRPSAGELGRLLHRCAWPVWLVDDERRVAFVNEPCSRWLGVAAEELLGRTVRFQSEHTSDAVQHAADALCPPPEVFGGSLVETEVVWPQVPPDVSSCRVQFVPLFDDGGVIGMVGFARSASEEKEAAAKRHLAAEDWHAALAKFRAEQSRRLRLDRLVGTSPAMQRVRAQVELAIATTSPVTIVGPVGSGRQTLARTIHAARGLAAGNLVPLACGSLAADLLRSALAAVLNAEATTTAVTLLLVEISALPAEAQADLAKYLATGNRRVQFLATATVSLAELASREELQPDLAEWFSALVIALPPLAARLGDLPLIVQMLVEDENAVGEKQLRGVTSAALDILSKYHWPGEMTELSATVQESHARAEGTEITPADLPQRLRYALEAAKFPRKAPQPINLEAHLEATEKQLIECALADAKGNKAQAARLLGLTRPRLYRRMVQFGLAEAGEEQ